MATFSSAVRVAVVGDVHYSWDSKLDARALEALQPDLVLFTGDFGNQSVELVAKISTLKYPKAAILGNHDCWFPHESTATRRLGESHVGYKRLDFPRLKLSVVGGRPGSWGGSTLHKKSRKYFGASSIEQSVQLITKQALAAPKENFLLFLAHSGPTGLGSEPTDICGKDWVPRGGDHGDRDLAIALAKVKEERKVPLVVFGHMHRDLQLTEEPRKMIVIGEDNCVYLNAAIVPRVRDTSVSNVSELKSLEHMMAEYSLEDTSSFRSTERNFTIVDIEDGRTTKITEVWVKVEGSEAAVQEYIVLYP